MKIYLDYVFLINFLFDFILLLGISIVLKRNISITRLIIGSIFGGLTFIVLFININQYIFFILKLLLGLIMIIITFGYKDIKTTINNFIYLIILSVLLGGSLYLINIEIGYSHAGVLFFTNGKSLNLIMLLFIGIIITILYTKYLKASKKNTQNIHKTSIFMENKEYKLNGFLDTGNELFYLKKPCLIINSNIKIKSKKTIYIPFTTISGENNIMKGFIAPKILIENYGIFKNVPIAIANDKFHLKGSDIILNINLMEEKNDNKNKKNNKKNIKKK